MSNDTEVAEVTEEGLGEELVDFFDDTDTVEEQVTPVAETPEPVVEPEVVPETPEMDDFMSDEQWEQSAERTDELAAELEMLKESVTIGWETVTPETAETILANNPNRKMKKRHTEKLAFAMNEGQWKHTGDTIKIDYDGNLRDGQHRLYAIIETGVARNLLVVRGIEPGAQLPMDTGSKRSFANNLSIKYPYEKLEDGTTTGINDTIGGTIDKIIQTAWTYANGTLQSGSKKGPENLQQKMDVFEAGNMDYQGLARRVIAFEKEMNTNYANAGGVVKFPARRGPLGTLMAVFDSVDPENAASFWETLSNMNWNPELEGKDPAQKLHNLLVKDAENLKARRSTMSVPEYVWHVTASFNAYRSGLPINKMQFVASRREGLPVNGIEEIDMFDVFGLPASVDA